jgi:predicted NBD/HSP70 family sugar kinase
MSINPDGAYFFGLKIGRRSAELVLTNFRGEVIDRMARTHRYPDPEDSVKFAHQAINALMSRMDPDRTKRIAGLGIAMPFYLWNWAPVLGVPDQAMTGWRHADIRADIAAHHDFPVYLENDASAACSAEVAFGPPDNPRDYLYFYVGYFIGGGAVLNGALFTGPGGNSGALGPMPVLTRDGSVRQLIEVASLSAVERMLADAGKPSDSLWTSTDGWDVDPAIIAAWIDTAGEGLARAIVAACSVIDFSAVVIDGWLPLATRKQLVEAVTRHLSDQNMTGLEIPVVREGTAGPDARSLGAASLPLFDRYLLDQNSLNTRKVT